MSGSAVSLNFCFWRLVIMLKAMESISSGVMRGTSLSGFRMPSTRRYGWLPTFRCKSEARLSTARRSRSSILMAIYRPGLRGASSSQTSMDCGGGKESRLGMVRNGQPERWDRWGTSLAKMEKRKRKIGLVQNDSASLGARLDWGLVGEENAVVDYAGQDAA